MVNWLKKLMSLFRQDFDNLEEENDNQPPAFMQNRQTNTKPNVVFRYPENSKFRFPVIPDEEIETASPIRKSSKPVKEPISKEKSYPFTPSQIPSPVYGFQKNSEKIEEKTIERSNERIIPFDQYKTKQNEIEEIKEVIQQNEKLDEEIDSFLNTPHIHTVGISQDQISEQKQDQEGLHVTDDRELELEAMNVVMNNDTQGLEEINVANEQEQEALYVTDGCKSEQEAMNVVANEIQEVEEVNVISEQEKEASIITDDREPELEVMNVVSNEIKETEEKNVSSDQEPQEAIVKIEPENESYEERKVVAPIQNTYVETEKNENEKVSTENHSRQEYKNQKKQDPSFLKSYGIPYNVLMLKKDKPQLGHSQKTEEKKVLSLNLLDSPTQNKGEDDDWIKEQQETLDTTLLNFNVNAKVVAATKGPSVTRYEVQPEPGVKVSKITNLIDDIKLSMAAKDIRIEAPIPGKTAVGIEVPNKVRQAVSLKQIIESSAFKDSKSLLTVSLGLDIEGNPVVTDIKKMPHGLIAGATGSGKSVCINSIILSLLFKASPEQVKLMLIDPKMVELAPYNRVPHLVSPVITDVKAATAALKWAVTEMDRRYEVFARVGVRDIEKYHSKIVAREQTDDKMPYLVIIIDELADLMMVSPQDVEECICRIAQKARACGIHLLVATQRPSVDVITGLIKANIPTRITFSVSSQADSRTIIDMNGAEKLLGKGDMLLLENGSSKPERIQGNFVSDDEIERVTDELKKFGEPNYLFQQEDLIKQSYEMEDEDELFEEACEFVFGQGAASASSLQRRFHIGYNRAARLIDSMEAQGIISEQKGSKPRDVLVSKEQYESMQETNG